ncbi:MAG: endo alpha-1,4 polygalactosaminidase [Candidatus Thiodiazotropha sp.]
MSDLDTTTPDNMDGWYKPTIATTWQLQLQGSINTGYAVELYDIDLFDTPKQTIIDLHAAAQKVICYFSGGTHENWRSDASQFTATDIGNNLSNWEGESWLDIRSTEVRAIMLARLDLAVSKGCDGVDVDNMDGYSYDSGFALTADDQLVYNRFIANAAHERRLSVGLKNDLAQIDELVDDFDFSVNESCFDYEECDLLTPFIQQGKPVLQVEYKQEYVSDTTDRASLCAQSLDIGFSTLILPQELDDSFRFHCR